MGQDPSTHNGQPFGPMYLAMSDMGSNQGWSDTSTPRLIGDVNGDGTPDIVGFGADNTFIVAGRSSVTAISMFNLQQRDGSIGTTADEQRVELRPTWKPVRKSRSPAKGLR